MVRIKPRVKEIVRHVKATHIERLEHMKIIKGSRKKYLLTKSGQISRPLVEKWIATWRDFKKLKIPTLKEFSPVFDKSSPPLISGIRQNDITRFGKAPFTNVHMLENALYIYGVGGHPDFKHMQKYVLEKKRAFFGIAHDLGVMNRNGFACEVNEEPLFTPWAIHVKPNKRVDRVVYDFGSVIKANNQREHSENVFKNLRAFEEFLDLVGDEKFKQAMIATYLKFNPNAHYTFS